ncbi:MAG TPA: hypothetical protein VHE37_02965 [Nevskiaceae bacterium]|nr:hypothetical protein [Nevskiaceae bacterium]
MKKTKMLLLALTLCGTGVAYAAVDATMQADKQGIDAACTADAATAGCGSDQVGTGLKKCLAAWHKADPKNHHLSAGCETAMKAMHSDRKAGK